MTSPSTWSVVASLLDPDTAAAIRDRDWHAVSSMRGTDTSTAIETGNWQQLGELTSNDTSSMIRRALAESASEADILAASARDDRDFLDDVKIAQHRARVQYRDGRVGA